MYICLYIPMEKKGGKMVTNPHLLVFNPKKKGLLITNPLEIRELTPEEKVISQRISQRQQKATQFLYELIGKDLEDLIKNTIIPNLDENMRYPSTMQITNTVKDSLGKEKRINIGIIKPDYIEINVNAILRSLAYEGKLGGTKDGSKYYYPPTEMTEDNAYPASTLHAILQKMLKEKLGFVKIKDKKQIFYYYDKEKIPKESKAIDEETKEIKLPSLEE